ncbi:MAG: class I SAM-dependent methyltransferase [Pseudomonadales bacterium]|nr:class I SAM-dependent methyltransferase [Pseudomonadales bacterium]
MSELNIPRAHSDEWYDQLATVQQGYFYPWQSAVGLGDGETAFLKLVMQHLTPDSTVLEIGCGHGELAMLIAPHCKQVVAYDRVQSYINLAGDALKRNAIDNIEYICHNAQMIDEVHLPVENQSVDLIIGRRAPLHWIADASRVCKPGASLISLCPMEEPIPSWSTKLPKKLHYENSGRHTGSGSIQQSVANRLHQASLNLDSGWSFDVPEHFADARQLYNMITWGLAEDEKPTFEDIEYKLDRIFSTYAESSGIVLRHCRYLWQVFMPS